MYQKINIKIFAFTLDIHRVNRVIRKELKKQRLSFKMIISSIDRVCYTLSREVSMFEIKEDYKNGISRRF